MFVTITADILEKKAYSTVYGELWMLHWMMGALESKWLKTTILDFPRGGKEQLNPKPKLIC